MGTLSVSEKSFRYFDKNLGSFVEELVMRSKIRSHGWPSAITQIIRGHGYECSYKREQFSGNDITLESWKQLEDIKAAALEQSNYTAFTVETLPTPVQWPYIVLRLDELKGGWWGCGILLIKKCPSGDIEVEWVGNFELDFKLLKKSSTQA